MTRPAGSATMQIGELAERNPNETVAIIRQWLTEPAK